MYSFKCSKCDHYNFDVVDLDPICSNCATERFPKIIWDLSKEQQKNKELEKRSRREKILNIVRDLPLMFLYYDRKDLSREEIKKAIENGEVSVEKNY